VHVSDTAIINLGK